MSSGAGAAEPVPAVVGSPLDDQDVQEELRVATEELHVQQQQIDQLLDLVADQRTWREQLMSSLPVAVYVTDERGLLTAANATAAAQLGVAHHHLIGRPLATYVAEEDRAALRGTWARLRADGAEVAVRLRMRRRREEGLVPVLLHGLPHEDRTGDGGTAARTSWFAFPVAERPADPSFLVNADDGRPLEVARALTALAALTVQQHEARELLGIASGIVRRAFPGPTV